MNQTGPLTACGFFRHVDEKRVLRVRIDCFYVWTAHGHRHVVIRWSRGGRQIGLLAPKMIVAPCDQRDHGRAHAPDRSDAYLAVTSVM